MTTCHHALPPETLIGDRYRVMGIMSEGGFYITYLARDELLKHQVTINEFTPVELSERAIDSLTVIPSTNCDEDYYFGLNKYLEQARELARLSHPHLISILDHLEANGTAYVVMDYERGHSLYDDLRAHPESWPEAKILKFLHPLLEGLHQIHSIGLLHRDIKPLNILLRQNAEPVLIDCGMALHAIFEKSNNLMPIVKQRYAPPEQYIAHENQGPPGDLYSIGAILYHLVTGEAPIESFKRSYDLISCDSDPLSAATDKGQGRYSDNLLRIIDQLLSLNPKDRIQTCSNLIERLDQKAM